MTAPAATCAHRWRCAEAGTMRLAEPGRYVVTGTCVYCGAERDHLAYDDGSNHAKAHKLAQKGSYAAAAARRKKAQGVR